MILYWEKGDIAKVAGVLPHTVKVWSERGYIVQVARTPRGVRLYDPKSVKAFLAERKLRQAGMQERARAKGQGR